MSGFLDFVRCLFCCLEDVPDDYNYDNRARQSLLANNYYSHSTAFPESYNQGPQYSTFSAGSSVGTTRIEENYKSGSKKPTVLSGPERVSNTWKEKHRESSNSIGSLRTVVIQTPSLPFSSLPVPSYPPSPKSSASPSRVPSFGGLPSSESILSHTRCTVTDKHESEKYIHVQKETAPIYQAPKSIEDSNKEGIAPGKSSASPSRVPSFGGLPSSESILSRTRCTVTGKHENEKYIHVQKETAPIYQAPKSIEDSNKEGIAPGKSSASPSQVPSSGGLPSSKSILSRTRLTVTEKHGKEKYIYVQKETAPIYKAPKSIEDSIKEGIVPDKSFASPSRVPSFGGLLSSESILSRTRRTVTDKHESEKYIHVQKETAPIYQAPKSIEDSNKEGIAPGKSSASPSRVPSFGGLPSSESILSRTRCTVTGKHENEKYIHVQKETAPIYQAPKSIEDSNKEGIAPGKSSASPSQVPSSGGLPSSKSILSRTRLTVTEKHGKEKYIYVQKETAPIYKAPKSIEDSIKEGIVPDKSFASPSRVPSFGGLPSSESILSRTRRTVTDKHESEKYIHVQKETAPIYQAPKSIEDSNKEGIAPGKSSASPSQVPSSGGLPSSKSVLSPTRRTVTEKHGKEKYIYVQKGTAPIYKAPKSIEDSIKEGIVPDKSFASPSRVPSFGGLPSSESILSRTRRTVTDKHESEKYIHVQKETAPIYQAPKSIEDSNKEGIAPGKSSASPSQVTTSGGLPSSKSILSRTRRTVTDKHGKAKYIYEQKGTAPIYNVPKNIEDSIKEGIVPDILKQPLTRSTYKDYFATLLYAEEFEIEKWKDYKLKDVKLELHRAEIYEKSTERRLHSEHEEKDEKIFVVFKIDRKQERPFLLSRDFVFAKPLGKDVEPYKGVISRVVKSNLVLVEFGDNFHSVHHQNCKYDISFSFNRVCLKRAHQAVESVSDLMFVNSLFPSRVTQGNEPSCYSLLTPSTRIKTVHHVQMHRGSPPYLVNGLPSETGLVVERAVCQIYHNFEKCRILICAPTNRRCDELMGYLKNIPESMMFRANATFREIEDVPENIIPSCRYKKECFVCPPVHELQKFKVISSTYMSSFRLYNEGISTGHFTHIFLMDASSALEPEVIVPIVNFADDKTTVIVTGESGMHPHWIRSSIGRNHGLRTSYFERLSKRLPYSHYDQAFF